MPTSPTPSKYPTLPSKLILTSTKSYFTTTRTISYLTSLLDLNSGVLPLPSDLSLLFALIPDFLSIHPCTQLLNQYVLSQPPSSAPPDPKNLSSSWPLLLGAQDIFASPTTPTPGSLGPYTGFITPSALTHLSISIVEIGHAERRRFASEDNALVASKAAAISAHGMIPLVCIGETSIPNLDAPMSMAVGTAMRQLQSQITSVLDAVPADAPVILAYEPVWAIGAAEPAGVGYVGPVVQAIRECVKGVNGRTGETRVVYGGSAGPGLWSGKKNGGNGLGRWVDGMFLGRFAHEVEGVKKVVDEVVESMRAEG